MSLINKVIYTTRFAKDAKPFIKKYSGFRKTLEDLENELLQTPRLGVPYGSKIYKIRVADESKGKGKSGGFRVITYVIDERKDGTDVYLITILDKSEEASIKKEDVLRLIKQCGL
jgi:mRNA-degrading endonuclease RelE of RelBE toxin-antitoxin system